MRVSSSGLVAAWFAVWCVGCGEPATRGGGPEIAAAGRPAGVSEGPRAAVILAVSGSATVTPSRGEPFAARPDQELLADDTIATAAGGLVVLELHNRHVDRVTPGGTLRVDALAVYGEPPAGDDVAERFAALLSPAERGDASLQVASRVAGWNMRMTAAQTYAPLSAPGRRDVDGAPTLEEPVADGPVEGEPPPPPADPSPEPSGGSGDRRDSPSTELKDPFGRGRNVESSRPRSEPESAPRTDDKKSSKRDEDDDSVGGVGKPAAPAGGLDLPDQVMFQADSGGKALRVSLPGPLVQRRAELAACAGAGATIRVQVRARKIVAVTVGGAPLKCTAALIGRSVGLDDGWIELRVQA